MVYIFVCDACQRGDHEHCIKGFPAPPWVYGGSKCICGHCTMSQKELEKPVKESWIPQQIIFGGEGGDH